MELPALELAEFFILSIVLMLYVVDVGPSTHVVHTTAANYGKRTPAHNNLSPSGRISSTMT